MEIKKKKFSRKSKSTLLSKHSLGMTLRHIETQNSKSVDVLYSYRFPKLSENLCNAVCNVYKFAFFMLTFYVILGICWEFLDVSYKYILNVGINWWSSNCKLSQNENRYLCLQWSHKSRKKNPQPSLYFTMKLRDSSLELISFINAWNSSSFDSKNNYSVK